MSIKQHSYAPPQLSEKLLIWALPKPLQEPIAGDLAEEFAQRVLLQPTQAFIWYNKQALRTALQFMIKTKKEVIMFLLSILLYVALTLMALGFGAGGDFGIFFDIPSVLLIFPPALLFAIGATSWSAFQNAFSDVLSNETTSSKQQLITSKQVFSIIGNSSILLAVFTTFIGAIAMGANITAEDFATVFGPAFAVCILVLMYAFGLKTLTYVAEQRLQFKINQLED